MINIYTDGACSGNPGIGGWAVIKVNTTNKEPYIISGAKEMTTNNEMELTAVLQALYLVEDILDVCASNEYIFNIHTDSAYIYNCFEQHWYDKWIKNGWKTTAKTPVKNKELWEEVLTIYLALSDKIQFTKVEGHASNKYNNLADQYAVRARQEIKK